MATDATIITCQQNCLDAATAYAAAGKYDSALEMLKSITSPELGLSVSLLRARVYAQQSEYDEALKEWENALAIDPENEDARQGLRLTKKLRGAGKSRLLLRARLHYGILVAVIAVLSIALFYALMHNRQITTSLDNSGGAALRQQEQQMAPLREMLENMQLDIIGTNKRNAEAAQQLSDAMKKLEADQAFLAHQAETQSETLRNMGEHLGSVNARQTTLSEDIDNYSKHVDELHKKLQTAVSMLVDTRVQELTGQLEGIDRRVGELNKVLSDHSVTITALEEHQQKFPSIVDENIRAVLDTPLEEFGDTLSKMNQHIIQLEGKADGYGQTVSQVKMDLSAQKQAVAAELTSINDSLRSTQDELGRLTKIVGYTVRDVNDLDLALASETRDMKWALRYILTVLAPDGCDSQQARIQELQDMIDLRQSELQENKGGELAIITPLMRQINISRLKADERKLQRLKAAYQSEVAPWRQAMEAVEPLSGPHTMNLQ